MERTPDTITSQANPPAKNHQQEEAHSGLVSHMPSSISIPFTGRATREKVANEGKAVEESAVDGVCGFGGVLVLVLM